MVRFGLGRGRLGLGSRRFALTGLEGAGGELMAAFIAFAAQSRAAADGAAWGGLFRQQLKQHEAATIADAEITELDDAGVATGTVGELRGDLIEKLLDDGLAGEFLVFIGQAAILQRRNHAPAGVDGLGAEM